MRAEDGAAVYDAPIQLRSDIHSLGVLLYDLRTVQPPFDPQSLLSAGLGKIRR